MTDASDEFGASETSERDEREQKPIPEAGFLGRWVARTGNVFAVAIILSALALIYEVIMRYGFNAPTSWAHETVIFLTAITFVYGGLYGVAMNKHIRVVLIYDMLSPKLRRIFNIVISLACAIASMLFSWAGWLVVQRAIFTPAGDFRLETSGSAWDPPTPGLLKLALLGILIVMSVQFLILTFNYLRRK
ncbi:TRAP transporter small permease subunit [Cohaesibacter gelatinilyticus]|uniref:TRAP transporter small permease protein n=1 Tax=Cohaesibacter gelatinilyticus TaxID=372072 RepID=A0A285PCX3_9HYPH|nr:TRAP transporter small permease [Cohaesibacter gelatinilyticus]SNZ19605.1 Tripartite ATP-independent transporter, DctQ component [Cohaesibacter gelatinilyticus]